MAVARQALAEMGEETPVLEALEAVRDEHCRARVAPPGGPDVRADDVAVRGCGLDAVVSHGRPFHSRSRRPFAEVLEAGRREEVVREPVEVADDHRIDRLRRRQRDHPPLGAPAHRARQVEAARAGASRREDEVPERGARPPWPRRSRIPFRPRDRPAVREARGALRPARGGGVARCAPIAKRSDWRSASRPRVAARAT